MRQESSETRRKRVLMIDDSTITLRVCSEALKSAGLEVDALPIPDAGALVSSSIGELLANTGDAPDLILMDINMPGITGDEVTRAFKKKWGIGTPIVLFSDVPEEQLQRLAGEAGADGYISKSWGVEELVKRVKQHLGDSEGC